MKNETLKFNINGTRKQYTERGKLDTERPLLYVDTNDEFSDFCI